MFKQYRTDVAAALGMISPDQVTAAIKILDLAKAHSSAVYIVGNGGSAATASHFANDLVKMCGIRAFSLPDMVPLMTAYGNDNEWKDMYSLLLRRLLLPMDVVIGISCSGNSPNVVEAMLMARHYKLPGLRTIGMIGADLSCAVAQVVPDVLIAVPWRDIKVQEDCHLIICHSIAGALKDASPQAKGIL